MKLKLNLAALVWEKPFRRSFRAKVVLQMCCFCYLCCFQQTSGKKKLTQCGAIPKLRRTKFFSMFMFLFSGNLQKTVVALLGRISQNSREKQVSQFEKGKLFSIFVFLAVFRKSPKTVVALGGARWCKGPYPKFWGKLSFLNLSYV